MSVDSWGGGSDQDPKLRLKEVAARERHKAASLKRKAIGPSKNMQVLSTMALLAVALYGTFKLALMALAWMK
ncbi:hypothetical protein [Solimonas sp. SE-A11]|uniref:hypothetical protein n=1 Tax=Solimonas sp. SE-A11 TaxID=3054954 RepID=UPI00259CA4B2|nr:hypothetical protein [Solimonas sp. SE-A11]MDM4773095.1 hypothetical protein [Solimonas sp. SE-A11]